VSCRDVWLETDLVSYSPDVDEDAADRNKDQRQAQLPERRVTPNMLVAYNMARWRAALGLTQEQLGERLGGWGKTAVSAAERSWDGKRVRQFDADLIVRLANIFSLPIPALFMPPPEDEETVRYVVDTGNGTVRMGDFFAVSLLAVADFPAAESGIFRVYDEVLVAATAKYTGSWLAEAVTARLSRRATDARLATALTQALDSDVALADFEDAIGKMRSDNDLLKDILVTMMRETEKGQALLAEQDQARRRAMWGAMSAEQREMQMRAIAIAHEMFGEHGPRDREEIRQLRAEASRRGHEFRIITRQRLVDGERELLVPPDGARKAARDGS
jgi:transcriptional regulator with XRE-family HTH domain